MNERIESSSRLYIVRNMTSLPKSVCLIFTVACCFVWTMLFIYFQLYHPQSEIYRFKGDKDRSRKSLHGFSSFNGSTFTSIIPMHTRMDLSRKYSYHSNHANETIDVPKHKVLKGNLSITTKQPSLFSSESVHPTTKTIIFKSTTVFNINTTGMTQSAKANPNPGTEFVKNTMFINKNCG